MRFHVSFIVSPFLVILSFALQAQEVGIQLNSFGSIKTDVAGTLAKVRKMGFTEVELNGTYGLPFPEFIKLLAINGLTVTSFETSFEKLQHSTQSVIDEARSFGAKSIVCSLVPYNKIFTKEDADKAVAVFNAAARQIANQGLLFCYQPRGYEFQTTENDELLFDYMLDKLDLRYVYLEMDVYALKEAGLDPAKSIKKYANRVVLLHLKDRKKTATVASGAVDNSVVLGSGDVGIAEVVRAAKDIGIKHIFISEESTKADQQILKSLFYVKSLL